MGMVMTTVRLDKGAKEKFDALCKGFGMSVNTAFTIYVNKVIEEGRIPFTVGMPESTKAGGLELLNRISGAWDDGRSSKEIVDGIRAGRSSGKTRVINDY